MENIKINDRLLTAVPFVRKGKRFADIGTDHGYLPIYLLDKGIINFAIAADINCGPLDKAEENIEKFGMNGRVKTVLCDGLRGINASEVDDVAIFGMGGELIMKIIDEAPWLKCEDKRVILQPMTHPEKLREYLANNGYKIVGETLSFDRDKIYQTICAEYDGEARKYDSFTLHFGEFILRQKTALLVELLENTRKKLERKIEGKKSANEDISEEILLLTKINKYIEE